VARRHAETTRRMFPAYPIREITNGIHAPTWAHPEFVRLFHEVAPGWRHDPLELANADQLPDVAVWDAHRAAKSDLLAQIERRSGARMRPDLPLIAFARRMTGYKRPDLLFADLDRLRRIGRDRPFQLAMAGKAHPRDESGKDLIRRIHAHMRELAHEIPMLFVPG
jgi:starch phosphorylase